MKEEAGGISPFTALSARWGVQGRRAGARCGGYKTSRLLGRLCSSTANDFTATSVEVEPGGRRFPVSQAIIENDVERD